MKMSFIESDGVVTISFSGLLSGTKESLEVYEKLSSMVSKKPKQILFDLKMVAFIDSLFIGYLLALFLKCKENKVDFQFISLSAQVREIFFATQLDMVFGELPE